MTGRLGARLGMAVLGIAFLAAAVAVYAPEEGEKATYAQLFRYPPETVDLRINGRHSVVGELGGILAPGSETPGSVVLTGTTGSLPASFFDLDFDLWYTTGSLQGTQHSAALLARFPHELFVTDLRHGSLDLLEGPDRDLVAEIDGDPLLGNQDGRLSVHELQAGANDLPPPGPPDSGTPFRIGLTLTADATGEYVGLQMLLTLQFFLADQEEEDLNY